MINVNDCSTITRDNQEKNTCRGFFDWLLLFSTRCVKLWPEGRAFPEETGDSEWRLSLPVERGDVMEWIILLIIALVVLERLLNRK
ncbi:MAG: hypothetical protein FWE86_00530 [Oscillospiraceae bacterium]|nr:hypothetical protein [Oscillospiraceae bacterium]